MPCRSIQIGECIQVQFPIPKTEIANQNGGGELFKIKAGGGDGLVYFKIQQDGQLIADNQVFNECQSCTSENAIKNVIKNLTILNVRSQKRLTEY